MAYRTFQILVNGKTPFYLEVVACEYAAALADLQAAYGSDVEVVQWRQL